MLNPKINPLFYEYGVSVMEYSQESLCYLVVSCLVYPCFSQFFWGQVLFP